MPTTYGNDIVYCLKSHCGVRGYCRQKWVLQVQIICKFSNERTCKRNKDVQGLSCGFEVIFRWQPIYPKIDVFLKKLIEIDHKCNIIVIFVVKINIIYERKNRLLPAL